MGSIISEINETYKNLQIMHINATYKDIIGNNGIGRYILLTGCQDRARLISNYFNNLSIIKHPRGHNLYTGTITTSSNMSIDVAAISTGMGASSSDIIVNELYALGAKRFIRVGTAGSMQPEHIKCGHVVIATAAVIDNDTASGYVPAGYPAIASHKIIAMMQSAVAKLKQQNKVFTGIVHSKSSLFSREILKHHNKSNFEYMERLKFAGVYATEMECSQLFILSHLFNHFLGGDILSDLKKTVLCGSILGIVGDDTPFSRDTNESTNAINLAIDIALESIKLLATDEVLMAI